MRKALVLQIMALDLFWFVACIIASMALYGTPLDLENGLDVWIGGFVIVFVAQAFLVLSALQRRR